MRKKDFLLPPEQIYMCGHSLGPMSKSAKLQIEQVMQAWSTEAVKAWNTDAWIDLPYQVAARIAPFIGSDAKDVVIGDSTSVNLFKVLMGALKINRKRNVILTSDDNFPADSYIAQGIQAFNRDITLKTVSRESLLENLNEQVAVLMLTHVNYRDASTYDLHHITAMAHQQGILTLWDLSHSVGALPLDLQGSNADFAVGCTYKYLNGGPGSPAFIYSHKRHHDELITPIYGWMGHETPFAFDPIFQARSVAQFISGTPYVLSLKALEGALKSIDGLDITTLRTQSLQYSMILIQALQALGLHVITPLNDTRGGHVAFIHEEGHGLARALIDYGVIVDYRNPGLIRMCVNPLYLDLADIHQCIDHLRYILDAKLYQAPQYQQALKVT
ncbi:MAG: kynureninase [Legionella sp.]|nr:MAG: kynureninase [Legionella sp.]